MSVTIGSRRWGDRGHYVGRGVSALGNPFAIGTQGARAEVIAKYEAWLRLQLDEDTPARREFARLLARVIAGEPLTLVCWCRSEPHGETGPACHADVIRRLLAERAARREGGGLMAESVARRMALGFDVLHEQCEGDDDELPGVLHRLPLGDEYLAAVAERARSATTGPWLAVERDDGDNWSVCWSCGTGRDMKHHAVTTDSIHASEVDGDAPDDAAFIAHAREDIPLLLLEIERQRRLLAKGWER
jgi:hypothetical protein